MLRTDAREVVLGARVLVAWFDVGCSLALPDLVGLHANHLSLRRVPSPLELVGTRFDRADLGRVLITQLRSILSWVGLRVPLREELLLVSEARGATASSTMARGLILVLVCGTHGAISFWLEVIHEVCLKYLLRLLGLYRSQASRASLCRANLLSGGLNCGWTRTLPVEQPHLRLHLWKVLGRLGAVDDTSSYL